MGSFRNFKVDFNTNNEILILFTKSEEEWRNSNGQVYIFKGGTK